MPDTVRAVGGRKGEYREVIGLLLGMLTPLSFKKMPLNVVL
jgi:hypothetical protein